MTDKTSDFLLGVPHWLDGLHAWPDAIATMGAPQPARGTRASAACFYVTGRATFLAFARFAQQSICWRRSNGQSSIGGRADMGLDDGTVAASPGTRLAPRELKSLAPLSTESLEHLA